MNDRLGHGDAPLGQGAVFAGGERQGLQETLVVELDAVALVGADEPVGRVGGRLVQVRVGARVRLDGEALLVAVADDGEDLGEGGLEGAEWAPLKLFFW